jgi:hypothetical protein
MKRVCHDKWHRDLYAKLEEMTAKDGGRMGRLKIEMGIRRCL